MATEKTGPGSGGCPAQSKGGSKKLSGQSTTSVHPRQAPAPKRFRLRRQVRIEPEMFESLPFRLLSAKAMWTLLRFLQKRTWTNGRRGRPVYSDEPLSLTYSEADAFGISRAQFHRTLRRLVELGFLDPVHRGGAYGRDPSTYRVSSRWEDYGTPQFREVKLGRLLAPGQDVQNRLTKKNGITRETP